MTFIAEYMEKNNLSVSEVAKRLGVSEPYVYMLKKGDRVLSVESEALLTNSEIFIIKKDTPLYNLLVIILDSDNKDSISNKLLGKISD